MTTKLGAITIGQSPRDDIVPEIKKMIRHKIEIIECGALDGLSLEQINQLAPVPGDYVLVTKIRDETPVSIARKHLIAKLRECIQKLEAIGVDLLVILGTGIFPELDSKKIILRPARLLQRLAGAILEEGIMGVVTPLKEQISQTRIKWERPGLNVIVDHALPYAAEDNIAVAARRLTRAHVDLIVLDCIAYSKAMKKIVRTIANKPVLLPLTLLSRTISELID